eukprot:6212276-Pleurochrysis_carterae.AAC.1
MVLTEPTRSFVQSTAFERAVGFLAASPFTLIYILAPVYLLATVGILLFMPWGYTHAVMLTPIVVSMLTPAWVPVALSPHILGSWACRLAMHHPSCESCLIPSYYKCLLCEKCNSARIGGQIPKYFSYEEYHETTDAELKELVEKPASIPLGGTGRARSCFVDVSGAHALHIHHLHGAAVSERQFGVCQAASRSRCACVGARRGQALHSGGTPARRLLVLRRVRLHRVCFIEQRRGQLGDGGADGGRVSATVLPAAQGPAR